MEPVPSPVHVEYESAADSQTLTRYDVAVIALRVMAIVLLLQALDSLFGLGLGLILGGATQPTSAGWEFAAAYVLYVACNAVAGVLLWVYSPRLSRWLLPSLGGYPRPMAAGAHQLQAIALSVIGVWLVASGLPKVIVSLGVWNSLVPRGQRAISLGSGADLLSLIQIVLGMLLFLGAKGLAALWHRLRQPSFGPGPGDPPASP